jgi:hypothetical protein
MTRPGRIVLDVLLKGRVQGADLAQSGDHD